jgi:hypothetical protein
MLFGTREKYVSRFTAWRYVRPFVCNNHYSVCDRNRIGDFACDDNLPQHLASDSQAGHPMKELSQRKEISFAKCRERGLPAMFDGVCNETVLIVVDYRAGSSKPVSPGNPTRPIRNRSALGERCVSLGPVRAGAPHSEGGGKSENVLSVDENHYVSGGDDEHCMMPLHVSAPLCGCDRSGFGARGAARRGPSRMPVSPSPRDVTE